jgi:DNA invertase Pin-like site-specific DNA recombinase
MAASATLLPKNFPLPLDLIAAWLMDGKFIAYYRVSTDHQGVNGNGMATQRKAVEDYLNGGCWKLVGEFTEVESGKRSDRPELEMALKACRKHKARLVIAKLDRLSRNVHFQRPDGAQG